MKNALEERIGQSELFIGRKEELKYFLTWIDNIKEEKSQSTAMLARLKTGKTVIMERLFNITFAKNNGVIPFYYEFKGENVYIVDFCIDFFFTFIYQYIAFKTRKISYICTFSKGNWKRVKQIVLKEGLDYLVEVIEGVKYRAERGQNNLLWNAVREIPKSIAALRNEYFVQMLDEFQLLNARVFWDAELTIPADTLAGGYLSTAESKVAPLLISGSWVGRLVHELMTMLPSRFRYFYLDNVPQDEAVEMIYKYSSHFDVPVNDETVYLMAKLTGGSPFYISSIMRSSLRNKDLTTPQGLVDTLEYETLDNRGVIKMIWLEYIAAAFPKTGDRHGKKIVLYLSQNRHREFTGMEIRRDLNLEMTDTELERKLNRLINADVILRGPSYVRYRGVPDNIFDKVFRGVYGEEIQPFYRGVIKEEYAGYLEEQKNV